MSFRFRKLSQKALAEAKSLEFANLEKKIRFVIAWQTYFSK